MTPSSKLSTFLAVPVQEIDGGLNVKGFRSFGLMNQSKLFLGDYPMEISIAYANPPCVYNLVYIQTIDSDTISEEGIITEIRDFNVTEIWLPRSRMILTLEPLA